jgi:hypothetical protein
MDIGSEFIDISQNGDIMKKTLVLSKASSLREVAD